MIDVAINVTFVGDGVLMVYFLTINAPLTKLSKAGMCGVPWEF